MSILIHLSLPHFSNTDGWATDDLVYKWKDVDPVQIVPGLHLPRFTLEQYKSAYCNVITNTGRERVSEETLTDHHICRRVQLSQGGAHLQERVLLLSHHHLRALLHASHRVLGLLLAGPQRGACPGVPGRDHPPHHVYPAGGEPRGLGAK